MLWAVIMAGGSGTRFWPQSRQANPKQFLTIFGRKSLLEQTCERLGKLIPPSRIIIVTQEDKVTKVRRLLKRVPASQVIGEPVGRNTAPCAVLAADYALSKDPNAVIALLPADHRIENVSAFQKALKTAHTATRIRKLPVTFGIKTASAHTGYGYLELDRVELKAEGVKVYRLKCFHEKPSLAKAKAYHRSPRFLWNSGMFVWGAGDLIRAAEEYLPQACLISRKILKGPLKKRMKSFYPKMPNISIDYGLMEKMRGRILALPVSFGWNDVGSWESLEALHGLDSLRNVLIGKNLLIESTGNIVKSSDRLIVLLGVNDHLVVDTDDAVLICPKTQTQAIRKVVSGLKDKGLQKYL
ncbi:MAG: mannose-1-phosphate guanylyltransferase [Candidatus Omnitrophica bacterium]|nr:mannose-1-phosphate guanylyltransferase [Candidatus Omnitrophota bacterium]